MEEKFRQYYKKDMNKSIFCNRWTFLTRCCYKYKTKCGKCPNRIVCEKYCSYTRNEYFIHPIKYATLMTLARLGKPKGELNMVAGYDSWLLRQADEYMRDCEPELDRNGEYGKCKYLCYEHCDAYKEIIGEEDDTRDE